MILFIVFLIKRFLILRRYLYTSSIYENNVKELFRYIQNILSFIFVIFGMYFYAVDYYWMGLVLDWSFNDEDDELGVIGKE